MFDQVGLRIPAVDLLEQPADDALGLLGFGLLSALPGVRPDLDFLAHVVLFL
jgi:hypothetical protein